jgi:hypothetical protein
MNSEKKRLDTDKISKDGIMGYQREKQYIEIFSIIKISFTKKRCYTLLNNYYEKKLL